MGTRGGVTSSDGDITGSPMQWSGPGTLLCSEQHDNDGSDPVITDRNTELTFLSGLNTLMDINRAFCVIFSVIMPVSPIDWIMPGPSETN